MMSRPYSGNVNDYRYSIKQVEDLDLTVHETHYFHNCTITERIYLRVETKSKALLAEVVVSAYDTDVLLIKAATWLGTVYNQLKEWK